MAISKVRKIGELVEVNKATATDWFAADLVPNVAQEAGELVKWIFQVSVNTATKVTIAVTTAAGTTNYVMNNDTALPVDTLVTQEIMIQNNVTGVNVTHATTTQNINCLVGEIRDFNSVG